MADKNSTIPRGWKMTTLGEVVDIKGGKRLPMGKSLVVQKTSHPYIRITDIENNKIKKNQLQFITDDVFSSISRYIVNSGDVIVSIVGSIGFVAIIDDDLDKASLTENCVKFVNLKNLDSKFLYYFLTSGSGQNEIERNTIGAVQKKLPIYGVQNIKIFLPSFPEQRAIAAVLSSLDDKIELLREQNKTLEAIAQAIFKEWFVNFNFPGATGKMIDSELGKIPEGWEVEKITDIFEFIKGSEPGAANYSNEKPNSSFVPFYRVQDISQYGDVPSIYVEEKLLKGKIFGQDDILISLDGTIGRVFIGGSGGHSGGIRRVIEKQDYIKKSLIFCFLKSAKFQNDLKSFSEAETTIKHAGGAVEYMKFVLNEKICERFGETIDPLFQKIISNISQIQTLSALRDTLLPKLMKGEIRVAEFNN